MLEFLGIVVLIYFISSSNFFFPSTCIQLQITVQRTQLNSPLGLEVQLHITEAVCPALSEPGECASLYPL